MISLASRDFSATTSIIVEFDRNRVEGLGSELQLPVGSSTPGASIQPFAIFLDLFLKPALPKNESNDVRSVDFHCAVEASKMNEPLTKKGGDGDALSPPSPSLSLFTNMKRSASETATIVPYPMGLFRKSLYYSTDLSGKILYMV